MFVLRLFNWASGFAGRSYVTKSSTGTIRSRGPLPPQVPLPTFSMPYLTSRIMSSKESRHGMHHFWDLLGLKILLLHLTYCVVKYSLSAETLCRLIFQPPLLLWKVSWCSGPGIVTISVPPRNQEGHPLNHLCILKFLSFGYLVWILLSLETNW